MLEVRTPESIHALVASLDDIRNKNYLTHGIHPYPAKFIPQIPACLIEAYSSEGNVILDPFCGSGTSLLEALIRGRESIGLDLNPIATLVARAKIQIIDAKQHEEILTLISAIQNTLKGRKAFFPWENIAEDEIPCFINRDHWFQKNVQRELVWLKQQIGLQARDTVVQDFLNVCLSAIIVKVSNQESNTRWKAIQKNIKDGDTIAAYFKVLSENLHHCYELGRIMDRRKKCKVQVFTAPVSRISEFIETRTVDLVATSPPYLNSYDYYLYHKLRMFWLGYDHKIVQSQEIGSRNKHCDNHEDLEAFILPMKEAFEQLNSVLKPNGKCVLVVGDSIYRGDLIDISIIYERIAKDSGFVLIEKASFDQRRYSKAFTPNLKQGYKQSHILVFGLKNENNKPTKVTSTRRSP